MLYFEPILEHFFFFGNVVFPHTFCQGILFFIIIILRQHMYFLAS